jgi:hypothetical protein
MKERILMKKVIPVVCLLTLVMFLASCATSSRTGGPAPTLTMTTKANYALSEGSSGRSPSVPPVTTTMIQGMSSAGFASDQYAPVVITSAPADKMIVRNGNMAIVVEDVAAAIEKISGLATGVKGNVISSNIWQDREILYGNISIRVPAEQFDPIMKNLRELAADVTSETTSSQDVTQEYIDLGSQLKNLQATEAQLLKIMEKADKVEDVLAVQRELTNVRGQIEQITGRMQYLERTSAMSLISINLQQSKLNLDFNANKSVVKEREETWFAASIAGGFGPYSYQWDLGDKTTSTEATFSHAYKNDGKYTVTLTVTDDHGNKVTKTRTDYITVIPGWSAGNAASGASNGLAVFGRAMADLVIWLGIFSPVWIIIGLVVFGVLWVRRKNKKAH